MTPPQLDSGYRPLVMTTRRAARVLGVSKRTVRRRCAAGRYSAELMPWGFWILCAAEVFAEAGR